MQGPIGEFTSLLDLRAGETVTVAGFSLAILLVGVWPNAILVMITPAVTALGALVGKVI